MIDLKIAVFCLENGIPVECRKCEECEWRPFDESMLDISLSVLLKYEFRVSQEDGEDKSRGVVEVSARDTEASK